MSVVALWLFDEAASGTGPTEVLDSSGFGTDADLTISYNGGAWTEIASGRGMQGAATTGSFTSGHKLFTAGSADAFSVTVAFNPGDLSPDGYAFPWRWADDVNEQSFTCAVTSGGAIEINNENSVGSFDSNGSIMSVSTYHQLTIVFDWLNATSNDRLRCYLDSSRVTSFAAYTAPTSALDLNGSGTNCTLTFGAADETFDITTFYAQIDNTALTDGEISTIHTDLASDNDSAAGGGGGGGGEAAAPQGGLSFLGGMGGGFRKPPRPDGRFAALRRRAGRLAREFERSRSGRLWVPA